MTLNVHTGILTEGPNYDPQSAHGSIARETCSCWIPASRQPRAVPSGLATVFSMTLSKADYVRVRTESPSLRDKHGIANSRNV